MTKPGILLCSLAILFANRAARAQTVDLQGIVTDRYGSQATIPGADVTLLKSGLTARTDAEGRFHMVSVPTGLGGTIRPGEARWVPGRGLLFRNLRAGSVSIRFLDSRGRARSRAGEARLGAGLWSFNPPDLPDGIYFVDLRTPDARTGFNIVQLGRGNPDAVPGFNRLDEGQGLAKTSASADSLIVRKAGYFRLAQAVTEYIQPHLAIALADSLSGQAGFKALFPSAGSLQPDFDPLVPNYALVVRESVSALKFMPIPAPGDPMLFLQNGYDVTKMAAGAPSDPIGLKIGHNPGIRVMSMSRDSSKYIYYDIDVLRVADTAAGLTGLISSPAGFTPAFSPGQFIYTLAMPPGATALSLTPTAQPLCLVQARGNPLASGQTSLPMTVRPGTDTIPVEVWSPNNQVKATYRVITTRPEIDTSGVPALTSLTLSPAGGFTPAFDPAITSYHAWYAKGPQTLKLTAVATNPALVVTLPGRSPVAAWDSVTLTPADSGNFAYDIKVAAADGSQPKTYTVGVSKGTDRVSTLNHFSLSPAYAEFTPSFSPNYGNYTVTMRQKDSNITVNALPDRMAATCFFNGTLLPNGTPYPMALKPWPEVTTLDIMVIAQDGVTKSSYHFSFKRYPPLGQPHVNGPSAGLKDTAYLFSQVLPSGCVIGSKVQAGLFGYQMDFGDGTAPVTGSHGLNPLIDDIRRAYHAEGTYAIKVRSFCNYDTSAWSPPFPIAIYEPTGNGKIKQISGPRSVSETWYKDTTYLITGKTLFEKATTLTIQPGTHIVFPDTANYLMILGGLSAVGTATDSIRFDRANLRIRWKGAVPTSGTYNPDGSYLAGPRMEFCSLPDGYLYIDRTDTDGGWGPYLRHSRVRTITGELFRYCAWSYIEHCRIDTLSGLRMMKAKILNSYVSSAALIADKGAPVALHQCDFGSVRFDIYDFTDSDISGNTFRSIGFGSGTPGQMHGNNILPKASYQIRANTGAWDMKGNYWGEAVAAEMAAKGPNQNIGVIYDYLDDVGLAKLDYSEWKTAEIADAKPDWP
jgi:hypothetical protein